MKLTMLMAYKKYLSDYLLFAKLSASKSKRFLLSFKECRPCLKDDTGKTSFDRHYVFHTAWAARLLSENLPEYHVDISSSLYFCTIVSAFLPVRFYDYRPADLNLSGLTSQSADLLALPFDDATVPSLSCMHVVEHVGLGRYGDEIDPDGDLQAISELKRVLSLGGSLLFVVPVGKPVIKFNAHRIYSYEQIVCSFSGLTLEEFSLIPDGASSDGLIRNATKEMSDSQKYGCGCFHFKKVLPGRTDGVIDSFTKMQTSR